MPFPQTCQEILKVGESEININLWSPDGSFTVLNMNILSPSPAFQGLNVVQRLIKTFISTEFFPLIILLFSPPNFSPCAFLPLFFFSFYLCLVFYRFIYLCFKVIFRSSFSCFLFLLLHVCLLVYLSVNFYLLVCLLFYLSIYFLFFVSFIIFLLLSCFLFSSLFLHLLFSSFR